MKINATQTQIDAYHAHENLNQQRLKVAEYIIRETKAGRLCWISKVAEHFAIHSDNALRQLSTASRAMNDLKKDGIVFGGHKYIMHKVKEDRPPGGRCKVEMWALVIENKETGQMALFE